MTAPLSLMRDLPPPLAPLVALALDLRWTWSHGADRLWEMIDAEVWELTHNPWLLLQNASSRRLDELQADGAFREEMQRVADEQTAYLQSRTWWDDQRPDDWDGPIAYFSLEYGLGEALPIYSGGLGVLAGDHLKTASDLGVPMVGLGLLYQEGYFRQMVDAHGRQLELYPANLPHTLPISAVRDADGGRLTVKVQLPGRVLRLQAWKAQVGRVPLYLLDSNDPLNTPVDRGITSQLYGGDGETRLAQEIALGIGGWLLLEALGIRPAVCHLNEGHAALVTLERARACMRERRVPFWEALWATRAGNVFTTHTPVAAAFDTFPIDLLVQYGSDYAANLGLQPAQLLALGRKPADGDGAPFNMAYLAARTCAHINAVSRLHGDVSRRIFLDLFPRLPARDVPIGHVTNGVHMPSWDSEYADRLWTEACGKPRWLGDAAQLTAAIERVPDEHLWRLRSEQRRDLVRYARKRLRAQRAQRGADARELARAGDVLDPNALTLGFARRFTEYKRPALLLRDADRLARLLNIPGRPVQLIVAGKAHPQDEQGKAYVQQWFRFRHRPDVQAQVVFLEDYDIALAQHLTQGVDVWVNNPRRPWEACGTSGMKVLVNGGLNLSELDGWWAEAYAPDLGWALGDGRSEGGPEHDAAEAEQLYRLLEDEVVPCFFERGADGLPRGWIARMRASMARLTPEFSTNRMLFEYVRDRYLPAAAGFGRRTADGGRVAHELVQWNHELRHRWHEIRLAQLEGSARDDGWEFTVQIYLGEVPARSVRVELCADAGDGEDAVRVPMAPQQPLPGAVNAHRYGCSVRTQRPAVHFTPRVVPYHPDAVLPVELPLVTWYSS